MFHKLKGVAVMCLLCAMLASCMPNGLLRVGISGHDEAFAIVRSNVPYYNLYDLESCHRLDLVKQLEKDQYGRALYQYVSSYFMLGGEEYVCLVICQKAKDEVAYYYEDYCYILRAESANDFTDEEIETFKQRNDWGKPLEETKMSSSSYKISVDDYFPSAETEAAIRAYLSIDAENSVLYYCFENNREILTVSVQSSENESRELYLMAYVNSEIVKCEKLENPLQSQDVIHEFKKQFESEFKNQNDHESLKQ